MQYQHGEVRKSPQSRHSALSGIPPVKPSGFRWAMASDNKLSPLSTAPSASVQACPRSRSNKNCRDLNVRCDGRCGVFRSPLSIFEVKQVNLLHMSIVSKIGSVLLHSIQTILSCTRASSQWSHCLSLQGISYVRPISQVDENPHVYCILKFGYHFCLIRPQYEDSYVGDWRLLFQTHLAVSVCMDLFKGPRQCWIILIFVL